MTVMSWLKTSLDVDDTIMIILHSYIYASPGDC